jgi:DNA-binding CsgD family transcriptional regulator
MATYDNTDPARKRNDEFWQRLRHAANVPCLVSGVFCADRKSLQALTVSVPPDGDPEAPSELIRRLITRMSTFTALRLGLSEENGGTNDGFGSARFPVWLRMNNVAVGVGRPVASLYPVVAYAEAPHGTAASLQDLLALGLFHIEFTLTQHTSARSTWPDGLAESTLRLLSIGLFVVDARGTILHDQSGKEQTKDPVWITSMSRLSVRSEPERAALQAAIADATSDKRQGSITSVTSDSGRMQMIAVAPMQLGDRALALVLFELRQTDHRALREHFFRVHELTRSESLIACEVLEGRAPAEIAQMTGMSVGTVRGYLKQVFSKTGTHRQSELVSNYYASILPIGASIARADLRAGPTPPRHGALATGYDSQVN